MRPTFPLKASVFLSLITTFVVTAAPLLAQEPAPAAAVPPGSFEKGVELYQGGKFKDAALEFGRVAAAGAESPAVYYNLANSWVRSGNIGKAVWAYERAFLMDPRDPDIRFNRALLRAALGEPVEADTGILEPVRHLLDYIRTPEIELALQLSTILLVLWLLGFAYIRSWRAIFGSLFWITVLVSTLVWGAAWIRWSDTRFAAAVVQDKEVFVRYGPTESDSKARQLKQGTLLRIEKQSGDWCLVRLSSGQTGWIPKSSILKVYP